MGDDEVAGFGDVVGGQKRRELREAEGREDAHDVGVVGEVEVEALVGGEGGRVVVKGEVDLGSWRGDHVVLEAGEDFLDVADTNCASGGALEGVVAGEADVYRVLVAFPLFVSEEITEGGVAEGDSFVGTEGLGVV